jgi:hypothetical protein
MLISSVKTQIPIGIVDEIDSLQRTIKYFINRRDKINHSSHYSQLYTYRVHTEIVPSEEAAREYSKQLFTSEIVSK